MKNRMLVAAALVAGLFVFASAQDARAFNLFGGGGCGCDVGPSCCEPTCCEPAPCCKPKRCFGGKLRGRLKSCCAALSCCDAGPSCCAAPAPACGCDAAPAPACGCDVAPACGCDHGCNDCCKPKRCRKFKLRRGGDCCHAAPACGCDAAPACGCDAAPSCGCGF